MKTRLVHVDRSAPDEQAIASAADVLARGGLVAFPTETVYGLGAHALDERAVAALFAAKERPLSDPVIVHVASADAVGRIARDFPPAARAVAARFWPGPITLVLPKQSRVPAAITAGLDTVGIRVPAHPVAEALLRRSAIPIAAPSANRFSQPSPTRAEHVLADLDERIDLVLDAGPTMVGVESTVLDLTRSPPLVRRPGAVAIEALRELLPDVEMASASGDSGQPQPAPGQLLRHYAPRARLTLHIGHTPGVLARVAAEARTLAATGARVGILAPEEDLTALAPSLAPLAAIGRVRVSGYGARRDPARAARELFDALRRLDAEGVDEILATALDPQEIGLAVLDRLTRAAEGRVRRS